MKDDVDFNALELCVNRELDGSAASGGGVKLVGCKE